MQEEYTGDVYIEDLHQLLLGWSSEAGWYGQGI
jgi:hypothetical protein